MAMADPQRTPDPEGPPRMPPTPRSARFFMPWEDDLPVIDRSESFGDVVNKLIGYVDKAIDAAYTYEQLRTTSAGQSLKPLILRLSDECHHPGVVAALLVAKYVLQSIDDDGTGLNGSRGLACELVAWQFLTFLSDRELIDHLLYEVPGSATNDQTSGAGTPPHLVHTKPVSDLSELTPLLESQMRETHDRMSRPPLRTSSVPSSAAAEDNEPDTGANREVSHDTLKTLAGMNALEIAGIAGAKRFMCQEPVQRIIDDIWKGNIAFWQSVSVQAVRKPRVYNKRLADPYTRLRVPLYQKAFQVAFFVSFLLLFYIVLVGRINQNVKITEVLLYLWIAAFAYDEFGEIQDRGILFYKVDFWSLWDVAIIGVSTVFVAMRAIGLIRQSEFMTDRAFDVLSMVALFLVPRIFSVMSLNSYFGSLIPVLKEMTKAFCKFLPVIVVLYLGFLTTFTMLARGALTLREMSWILVQVFFGASYLGFDVAVKISPYFGYPLMLIFVCLTNILLITSLVSLVSNSLTEVMAHARTEYYFQYSIYVLESSTSRRLTYFMPPLNLIPLLLLRPLRLVLPSDQVRRLRILLLKATHIGFVALIMAYESSTRLVTRGNQISPSRTFAGGQSAPRTLKTSLHIEREPYAEHPCQSGTLGRATPITAHPDSASGVADPDVMKLLRKLCAQVDELSAMVAEQQTG